METTPRCPNCGKPLAPTAPKGLCQECLLKAALPTGTDTAGKTPPFNPPSVAELAAKFPQLEILELIGSGGMGAVYRTRQKELDRIVALKILPPDIGQDAAFTERFTREARALAKLNHSGIVTLYEFGRADGLFYFLMEFVDGVSLRGLLERGRVSSREALAIVPQICDALQYAHDQGIVHRDIKPENVLLDRRGRVKVADFGLAKLVGSSSSLTSTGGVSIAPVALTEAGKIMGTPHYMAPEQVEHPGEVDHRADIYALGVVLYQMLTGELPGKPLEPPSKRVSIDVRLDEVVLRALEEKPERRYQQASVLKTEMETIAASAPASQPPAKSELVRFSENLLGMSFTSPTAIKALNVAMVGFFVCICAVALIGLIKTPWLGWCVAIFGLLAVSVPLVLALLVENGARRSTGSTPRSDGGPQENPPSAKSESESSRTQELQSRVTEAALSSVAPVRRPARIFGAIALLFLVVSVLVVLTMNLGSKRLGTRRLKVGTNAARLQPLPRTTRQQIQEVFSELKNLKAMDNGRVYTLVAAGQKFTGASDDFLRRRTGPEILASRLSCGCGDYATAFISLIEKRGFETLWVEGAEISAASLKHRFSGHVVVAVHDASTDRWILADPTARSLISDNWSRNDQIFPVNYWSGFVGPFTNYPVHSPEALREFYDNTLKSIPPEVFNRRVARLKFAVDPSLQGPDGAYLNTNLTQFLESQSKLLDEFGIRPADEVNIRFVKGADDAHSTLTYSEEQGWFCTIGLQSACSLSFLSYLEQGIARHRFGPEFQARSGTLTVTRQESAVSKNVQYETAPVTRGELTRIVAALGSLTPMGSNASQWEISAAVPENVIAEVEAEQDVVFTMDAFGHRQFKGKVVEISNTPLTQQNVVSYATTIKVADADPRFRPGMSASISFITARRTAALKIPIQALRVQLPGSVVPPKPSRDAEGRATETIYLLKDSAMVVPVRIRTGIADDVAIEVLEGLKEGDRVVVRAIPSQS